MTNWMGKYSTVNSYDNSYQEPWLIRLWKAALARAYSDLLSENSQGDYNDFKCARRWILADPSGTFQLTCEALNIADAHIRELRQLAATAVYHGTGEKLLDYQKQYGKKQHVKTYVPRERKPRLRIIVLTPEQRRAKAREMYRLRCAQAKRLKLA